MVSATGPMDPALGSSEFVNKMWVQCENESCLKWRLLSPEAAARVDLSEPWYCSMNTDSSYNSCAASEQDFPEESQFLESGYKIVYSQLPLGSLVLVKLQNWPSWPGILCPDPFKGKYVTYDQDGNVDKYYIEFLGDPHSTAWISATFVGHFSLTLKVGAVPRSFMLSLVSFLYCHFLSQAEYILTFAFTEQSYMVCFKLKHDYFKEIVGMK